MKKNPLVEHCNEMFCKAAVAARRNNRVEARKYLFEALDSLKYLCLAESNAQVLIVYETRARELLTIARLIRQEGFTDRVNKMLRLSAEDGTGMSGRSPVTVKDGDCLDECGDMYRSFFGEEPPKDMCLTDNLESANNGAIEKFVPLEDRLNESVHGGGKSDVDDGTKSSDNENINSSASFCTAGSAMRPQLLKDYYGQPKTIALLFDATAKARLSDTSLAHVLLYGSHGLGKTTLARILANEMQTGFIEINNAGSLTADGMIDVLKNVKKGDIVFIDEIHNIPPSVAEGVLYSAMEDFTVKYVTKKGKGLDKGEIHLPPFTIVGATTETGKLLKPFKDRFGMECHLVPYSVDLLELIARNSFKNLGLAVDQEVLKAIARRARKTPRIVNRFVARIADKAIVRTAEKIGLAEKGALSSPEKIKALNIRVTADIAEEFFKENGIDELGLTDADRTLLKLIVDKFNGGPVGIDSLAKSMHESQNVIADQYEAYLTEIGMLITTSRGRMAMPAAYKYLGLPVPQHIGDYFNIQSEVSNTKDIVDKSAEGEKLQNDVMSSEEIEQVSENDSDK